ncbi:MAG: hypothetical protein EB123_01700, partial [Synechococcaceae bacterium WBB_32_011]|nr:hypothetical protein [Synechococcaceae bacterium WBB_32_011]
AGPVHIDLPNPDWGCCCFFCLSWRLLQNPQHLAGEGIQPVALRHRWFGEISIWGQYRVGHPPWPGGEGRPEWRLTLAAHGLF